MTPERWQQICDVFQAALERDAGQRASFLARACDGDAALRAEVEAMLDAHEDAQRAGDIPSIDLSDELLLLQPGTILGAYRIDALIGAGGMGQVYRAHHPRIGRDIAVKVLPAAYGSDAESMRRFEQEARASGALSHPNVVSRLRRLQCVTECHTSVTRGSKN